MPEHPDTATVGADVVIGEAETASEAIQAIVRATTARGVFDMPSDVHAVLVSLAGLASHLPDVIGQLTVELLRLQNTGAVRHDEGLTGDGLDGAVTLAADFLSDGRETAELLAQTLAEATGFTSHLTGGEA